MPQRHFKESDVQLLRWNKQQGYTHYRISGDCANMKYVLLEKEHIGSWPS